MNKTNARETLFRHLDGLVTVPVVAALLQKGLVTELVEKQSADLADLAVRYNANEGYLNVALRVLAAQGYLAYQLDAPQDRIAVTATEKTASLLEHAAIYTDIAHFLPQLAHTSPAVLADELCEKWVAIYRKYRHLLTEISSDAQQLQVQKHVEGCLFAPLIVRLGMSGMFHNYFMQSSFSAAEFHKNPACFENVLLALTDLGWFTHKQGHFAFTEWGLFFAKRATAYGVTVSYLPMLTRLDELLYGDPAKLREIGSGEDERHVDREMNVWGSGGAHANYFKVIDDFILSIFNQPLELQPKGILDMGCGNGALLQHLYEVIERQTLRGRHLEEHPLFLVGADYNQAALKVTRANLIKSDIWAKLIWGDIGNPDVLAEDLRKNYRIELGELLNMRTFLDHNRVWEPTEPTVEISSSTGAFAYRGQRLSNRAVETNLQNHLRKWAPYVQKYGLMLIELHTISPALTAHNLGKTAATAYDATHGFSDQYIVEVDIFHKACEAVGLQPDPQYFKRFPDSDLATVSINLLKAKTSD